MSFFDYEHSNKSSTPWKTQVPSDMRLRVSPYTSSQPKWDSVKEVVLVTSSTAECPICLDTFLAPQVAPCCHAYCLPCLLQLFFPSPEAFDSYDAFSTNCPVCKKLFSIPDTRPLHVVYPSQTVLAQGQPHSFVLCAKSKADSAPFLPVPDAPDDLTDYLYDRVSPFYNPGDVITRHHSEIDLFYALRGDPIILPFISFAHFLVDLLEAEWYEQDLYNSKPPPRPSRTSDLFYSYVDINGTYSFIHPLFIHCLAASDGGYSLLPAVLEATVKNLSWCDTYSSGYKQFESICGNNCSFSLIEIDLEQFVSEEVFRGVKPKLLKLEQERKRREERETRLEEEMKRKVQIQESKRKKELFQFTGVIENISNPSTKRKPRFSGIAPAPVEVQVKGRWNSLHLLRFCLGNLSRKL
ncbi:hypothetical protein GEMRC1_002612 [Eukaryota sp. GEM-RC1]